MKLMILFSVFLFSCSGLNQIDSNSELKRIADLSEQNGKIKSEISVKTIYPDLDWVKIDSVYKMIK